MTHSLPADFDPASTSTTRVTPHNSRLGKDQSLANGTLHSHFSTHPSRATRPLPFFHPTRAEFIRHPAGDVDADTSITSRWSSRASRKNRYSPAMVPVHKSKEEDEKPLTRESSLLYIEQRLRHPQTQLKVHLTWDVSFWVAVTFVLGSSAWIANGFILYLPISPTVVPQNTNAAAAIAFVGGTLFELGSYLMYVESLNTGHEELFGEELLGMVEGKSPKETRIEDIESASDKDSKRAQKRKFRWIGFGSFRELGFLASFVQMWAASIFWISTITGLPGVIPNLYTDPPTAITDVFYWTPQVIGGTGFMISSILLMLEVQKSWWLPNLKSLGWHIGFWNLVGAIGFTMCGALGYAAEVSTKSNYQSVMSTFWGSWAFMIGSCIQQWETLWRDVPADDSTADSS